MQQFWDSLPPVVRTIINVAAGAGLAALVTYLTGVVSGGSFDVNAAVQVVLTAVGTAIVRALNPADAAYGLGSSAPADTVDPGNVGA